MKVKNITGRILAGILAAVLMFTSMPQTAYAIGDIMEAEQGMTEEESDSDDGSVADAPEQDGGNDENGENTERDNGEENTTDGDTTDGNDADDADSLGAENSTEPGSDEETEQTENVDTKPGAEEDGEDVSTDGEAFDESEAIEGYGQIATYAANQYTQQEAVKWANDQVGKITGQCVRLIKDYYAYLGENLGSIGEAKNIINEKLPSGWERISKDADGFALQSGDIAVWTSGEYATYGHVGIVVDTYTGGFKSAELNYAKNPATGKYDGGVLCAVISHSNMNGFWGVIRPDFKLEVPQDQPLGKEMSAPFGFDRAISDGDYHIVSGLEGDPFHPGTKCLTIGGLPGKENADANAELWAVNGWNDHVFTVTWIDSSHGYNIKLKKSAKHYLAVDCDNKDNGLARQSNVIQKDESSGSSAQQWVISSSADGYGYTIQSRRNGFYVDVENGETADKTNISLWDENKQDGRQRWYFIPWDGGNSAVQIIPNGEYEIVPKANNSKALSADGTIAKLGTRGSDGKHVFQVTYLGNGYYKMINKNLGSEPFSLEVTNAQTKKAAQVGFYKYNATSNQEWIIKSCGDGYSYIVSKCNGLCVDLAIENDDDAIDGTKIHMWNIHGGDNQKWKFVPYIKSKLDSPTANIPSDTEVEAGTQVSLSCNVDGAEILYTLNGTEPQVGGLYSYSYSAPIIIDQETTVKAIAVKEGYSNSDIASFVYRVKESGAPDNPRQDDIPNGLWVAGLSQNGYEYTGKAIKPAVRVYDHKTLLTEKKDYTISYTRNTKAYGYASGDQEFDAKKAPTITVTAKGNYSGKETLTFKILPPDIGSGAFAADDMTIAYKTKGTQKPIPILMWKDKKLNNKTDYTVTYYDSRDNKLDCVKEAGVYYVEMTGKGNFVGTRRVKLTVTDRLKLMSKMSVAGIKSQPYTGSAITPPLTVKDGKTTLTEGTHYMVSYSQNTSVGTACAIVTGIEEAGYSGTKRISFKITGTPIKKAVVTGLSGQKFIYEGIDISPAIQLSIKSNADEAEKTLMMGTDYTVTWQKNRNAGTATVVFTGKGGYTGTLKKTFKIGKFDIAANTDSRFTAELEQETVPYAKGSAKPTVVVKFRKSDGSLQSLTEGQDYTLSCRNHTAVNDGSRADKQPTVTVKGKGNFSGTFGTVLTYKIAAQDIGQLTLSAQDRTYQNKKNIYATKVTITDLNGKALKAGTDYSKNFTYTYKYETVVISAANYGKAIRAAGDLVDKNDIIPAGTVLMVTANAKDGGNYSGTVTGEYRITQAAISSASISIPKQTYTGRAIILDKSQITVKMKGNPVDQSQYEIVPGSYKNNVKKGTASVTIRGIDNYGGTKTVKFSIRAKGFLWWWK